ncbi:uncharacterized protein LOC129728510 [Wyeomyia smithii]|uniref:uncharacterized protein LOC129728510 n=1 Tax=Wyeomyia smithii TaxID=174621 RepID=UPI002467CEFA|nr:uncharacterized protein LOC129728510 [Wyeomyia smithii]
MKTGQIANKIQADKSLNKLNYKAYIPKHFIAISGVVTGVPIDMTLDEIMENMTCVVPILGVNRLYRYVDGEKVPASRIGITFKSNRLPSEVRMFCCNNYVKPFANKAVFCNNCLRYNHKSINCRARQRCGQCGQLHENGNNKECKELIKCLHCRTEGQHQTGDFGCPERKRQNNLKTIMATTNLTVVEIREQYPIYTENQFSLLENIREHPTLVDSYADTVKNKVKPGPTRQRHQQAKRIPEEDPIESEAKAYNDKKRKTQDSGNNGVALFNRYKVDKKEKLRWKMELHKASRQRTYRDHEQNSVDLMEGQEEETYSGMPLRPQGLDHREQSSQPPDTNKIRYNYGKFDGKPQ